MARSKHVETNKPEKWIVAVRNNESSVDIPAGTPLVLNLSGTPQPSTYQNGLPAGAEDGLQVVLPTTGGAFASRYYNYGVALGVIANKQLGESQVHGVCSQALIVYATRAASTDSWSVSASVAASLLLTIDTINNAFTTIASTANLAIPGVLVDSITNVVASASNTSDSRTALTTLKRVFLRLM